MSDEHGNVGADEWIWSDEGPADPVKRQAQRVQHMKERVERGWSTFDWWGGDHYLAAVIAGMARKYASEEAAGYPAGLTWGTWQGILLKGIAEPLEAFLANEDAPFDEYNAHAVTRAREAMKVFAEWWPHFWD